jgi:type IV secretory pathway VirB10-like protein
MTSATVATVQNSTPCAPLTAIGVAEANLVAGINAQAQSLSTVGASLPAALDNLKRAADNAREILSMARMEMGGILGGLLSDLNSFGEDVLADLSFASRIHTIPPAPPAPAQIATVPQSEPAPETPTVTVDPVDPEAAPMENEPEVLSMPAPAMASAAQETEEAEEDNGKKRTVKVSEFRKIVGKLEDARAMCDLDAGVMSGIALEAALNDMYDVTCKTAKDSDNERAEKAMASAMEWLAAHPAS